MTATTSDARFLNGLLASLSLRDFKAANPKPRYSKQTGSPIYKPYSLAPDTLECREMYLLSIRKEITRQDAEAIKAYILKRKLLY